MRPAEHKGVVPVPAGPTAWGTAGGRTPAVGRQVCGADSGVRFRGNLGCLQWEPWSVVACIRGSTAHSKPSFRRGRAAAYERVAESIASKEVRGAADRRIAVLEPRLAASDQGKR